MNSWRARNKAQAALPRRFWLNSDRVKLVKIALIGALTLVVLGGATWGVNAYRVVSTPLSGICRWTLLHGGRDWTSPSRSGHYLLLYP